LTDLFCSLTTLSQLRWLSTIAANDNVVLKDEFANGVSGPIWGPPSLTRVFSAVVIWFIKELSVALRVRCVLEVKAELQHHIL
jgi:hypothetical protein